MQVPVFVSAAEILARLKTVDSDVSGLNANTLQGYVATDFSLAGHAHSYQPLDTELTAIAGLTSAANTVPSFTGLGTAALLTVGTGANNLVQLTAASKLPAVDGSLLTNLATGLAPTGATTGATSQIQTLTYGAKASVYRSNGSSQPGMVRTDSILEFQDASGGLVWDCATGTPLARFFGGLNVIGGDLGVYAQLYMVNGGVLGRSSGSPRFRFDFTDIAVWSIAGPTIFRIMDSGATAVGHANSPGAYLDIAASTTARASLRLRTGVAPTTPNDGDIWHATRLKFYRGATTEQFATGVQGAAITQTYATAARTVNAYTTDAEVAYTGQDALQAGNVYAKYADLEALRVAYTNLEAGHLNLLQVVTALIDDAQAFGLN